MDPILKLRCEIRTANGNLLEYDRYRNLCPICYQDFRDLVDQFLSVKKGWQS